MLSLPLLHCVALQIQLSLAMERRHPSWPILPSMAHQSGTLCLKRLEQWSEWQPVACTTKHYRMKMSSAHRALLDAKRIIYSLDISSSVVQWLFMSSSSRMIFILLDKTLAISLPSYSHEVDQCFWTNHLITERQLPWLTEQQNWKVHWIFRIFRAHCWVSSHLLTVCAFGQGHSKLAFMK